MGFGQCDPGEAFPSYGRVACNQITSFNIKYFRTRAEVLEDYGTKIGRGNSMGRKEQKCHGKEGSPISHPPMSPGR